MTAGTSTRVSPIFIDNISKQIQHSCNLYMITNITGQLAIHVQGSTKSTSTPVIQNQGSLQLCHTVL